MAAPRRPPGAARGARRDGDRVLRPADPRPRALPLPVLRARRDPAAPSSRAGRRVRVLAAANFANLYAHPHAALLRQPRPGADCSTRSRRLSGRSSRESRSARRRASPACSSLAHAGGSWLRRSSCPARARRDGSALDDGEVGDDPPPIHDAAPAAPPGPRRRVPAASAPPPPRPSPAAAAPPRGRRCRRPAASPAPGRSTRPTRRRASSRLRPVRVARSRGRRPSRSPRPVVRHRPRRRGALPPDVPARRADADALRRGLPRADRDRVPPALDVRRAARIYEYTHPHLAKYAMAVGIELVRRQRGRRRERRSGPGRATPPSSRAGTTRPYPAQRQTRGGERLYLATGATRSRCTTCARAP